MYGWMDQQIDRTMDRQNNGWTGQGMDRDAMDMHRRAKHNDFSIDFAIFTKALRTNRRTNGPMNGHTLL